VVFCGVVFFAAFVVGVAAGAGEAHLEVFSCQVGADEVACVEVGVKFFQELLAALLGEGGGFEAPEGGEFGLVGLADEDALLAFADAVQLGVGAVVDVGAPGVGGLVEVEVGGAVGHRGGSPLGYFAMRTPVRAAVEPMARRRRSR